MAAYLGVDRRHESAIPIESAAPKRLSFVIYEHAAYHEAQNYWRQCGLERELKKLRT
jgi:hypothetical protein